MSQSNNHNAESPPPDKLKHAAPEPTSMVPEKSAQTRKQHTHKTYFPHTVAAGTQARKKVPRLLRSPFKAARGQVHAHTCAVEARPPPAAAPRSPHSEPRPSARPPSGAARACALGGGGFPPPCRAPELPLSRSQLFPPGWCWCWRGVPWRCCVGTRTPRAA